jgi:peptidoglycan/LPS O-acetylase OafA/YrhL
MPPASNKIAYRPDIDGLRAIAVLGVVFFHAGLRFPGGYVGVDVFFVISGFLITSLLLKELRQGTFSLLNFWERRARRILPALAVVVAAIIAAGWFFLMPADYETLGKQVIALIGFSSNVKFWRETGYFAAAAETKPLLHTWSLSLEEQFYLLIPLLLAFLFWIRKSNWIVPTLLLGAVVSFGLSVYGSYRAPAATFFLLPTRAWELATGSLLAFAPAIPQARLRTLLAWIGLAAICVPFFFYAPGIRFPGLTALPPVAGAALLIWSGFQLPTSNFQLPVPNRLLASRPFVWIGLLSYSLYLWHWPLFAFQKYISFTPAALPLRLSLVAASVMLAWLSLRFVERPFRSRAIIRSRNHVFALSAGAVAALVLTSLLLWKTNGAKNRLTPEAQRLAAGTTDFAFINELKISDIPDNLVQLGNPTLPPKVLVWGDSHAMAILPAVDLACKNAGIAARAATASATAPVLEWFRVSQHGLNENAPAFNAAVLDYIKSAASQGLSHVILAASWEGNLTKEATGNEQFQRALRRTVGEIQAAGCRVVVLIDVPRFSFNPPRTLTLNALRSNSSSHLVTDTTQYFADTALQRPILSDLSQLGVTVIDPAEFFTDANGIIRPADSGGCLYRDSHHLSTHGSQRLTGLFSTIIQSGGSK